VSAVAAVELWEVHSELVLVSAEVYERALELLPERDPNALLPPRPRVGATQDASSAPRLAMAIASYTIFRLAETARTALIVAGAVVALALAAQILS
jgi:hypothetical protein